MVHRIVKILYHGNSRIFHFRRTARDCSCGRVCMCGCMCVCEWVCICECARMYCMYSRMQTHSTRLLYWIICFTLESAQFWMDHLASTASSIQSVSLCSFVPLSLSLSECLSLHVPLSLFPSLSRSVYLSVFLSHSLSVSVSLSLFLPVYLSVCLSFLFSFWLCLSLFLFAYLSICQSVSVSLAFSPHLPPLYCHSYLLFYFLLQLTLLWGAYD